MRISSQSSNRSAQKSKELSRTGRLIVEFLTVKHFHNSIFLFDYYGATRLMTSFTTDWHYLFA